jgi:SAM-dependent methyltransferase
MIRTLQSNDEIVSARDRLRERGLDFTVPGSKRLWDAMYSIRFRAPAPPSEMLKAWDVANVLEIAEGRVPLRDAPILDLGCYNSAILWTLHRRGFGGPLFGCDLNPLCRWMPYWHQIRYEAADLTHTSYPDRSFALITCISVIEHGVPADALVSEVVRLLKPGGIFVFTTDYDASGNSHNVAPQSRPFGLEWKIYTRPELWDLIARFQRAGLSLLEPDDVCDRHVARPITWEGESYTFVMVALRAPAA